MQASAHSPVGRDKRHDGDGPGVREEARGLAHTSHRLAAVSRRETCKSNQSNKQQENGGGDAGFNRRQRSLGTIFFSQAGPALLTALAQDKKNETQEHMKKKNKDVLSHEIVNLPRLLYDDRTGQRCGMRL